MLQEHTAPSEDNVMVLLPKAAKLSEMPGSEPVPEGLYHIRCDKATFKTSASKKEPMVEAEFTITGPAEQEEYVGRKVFDNLMLAGKGQFRTRQLFEATGEDKDFEITDTDQFVGRECAAAIEIEAERANPDKPGENYPRRNRIGRYLAV